MTTPTMLKKAQSIYRSDRHVWRLIIMITLWMIFMAITRFRKLYVDQLRRWSQFPSSTDEPGDWPATTGA